MSERTPESFMAEAVELSRRGYPAPNPHVGCVIVRAGGVVGRGYHDHAGGPHAEVVALQEAGENARGADVYVTLEPCNHVGRTGACSEALLRAGVARVIYAVADPNPRAQGGADRLRLAGISVEEGLLAEDAAEANKVFLSSMRLSRPYVTIKAACSLDGRIALENGESQWITGEAARIEGQRLRAEMGAVLIGAETARKDNPRLTSRVKDVVNQPVKIVLDPNCTLSPELNVFMGPGACYHIVGEDCSGRSAIRLPLHHGKFELSEVLSALWERGVTSLLVEGGGVTIGGFLEAKLVDRLELFFGPIVIGKGRGWSGDLSISSLAEAPRLRLQSSRMVGEDLWVTAVRG